MASKGLWILVGAIGAIIIVGGAIGAWIFWQQAVIWQHQQEEVEYDFDLSPAEVSDLVTLDVHLGTGGVEVTFVNDDSLLYRIHFETNRWTVNQYGDPIVTFNGSLINLTYETGGAKIELGRRTNYTLDIQVGTGSLDVRAGANAHIGDVTLNTMTGAIDLLITNAVTINDNSTIILETGTGSITVNATLPSGIGGSFTGSTSVGDVEVMTSGTWSQVSGDQYETSDYDTAETTVTMTASTETGDIIADLG